MLKNFNSSNFMASREFTWTCSNPLFIVNGRTLMQNSQILGWPRMVQQVKTAMSLQGSWEPMGMQLPSIWPQVP